MKQFQAKFTRFNMLCESVLVNKYSIVSIIKYQSHPNYKLNIVNVPVHWAACRSGAKKRSVSIGGKGKTYQIKITQQLKNINTKLKNINGKTL